ncbi:MAG: LacI family DNA-binding transcriptional regulator, partial [Pseudomonadota bacterium]
MTERALSQRPRRAKINDVATMAGVSTKTVSRVLNNEPNVKADTRTKVKAAVKALNYVPDFSARSLAGQKSFMFALFYDTISEGYLSAFQEGALSACRTNGYHLLIEKVDLMAPDAPDRILETTGIFRADGVILLPPLSDDVDLANRLVNHGTPVVRVATLAVGATTGCVEIDDQAAAQALAYFASGLSLTKTSASLPQTKDCVE